MPKVRPGAVILDGLFGSGLNRPLEGFPAEIVKYLNQCDATRIAIDIPSGLFGEDNSGNNYDAVFRADYTLTFQFPSISFFFPEHEDMVGKWYILPIGLDSEKIEAIEREDSNIPLLTMASFTTVVSLALVVTLCTYLHSKYKRLQ